MDGFENLLGPPSSKNGREYVLASPFKFGLIKLEEVVLLLNRICSFKSDFWSYQKFWVESDCFVLIESDRIVDKIKLNHINGQIKLNIFVSIPCGRIK